MNRSAPLRRTWTFALTAVALLCAAGTYLLLRGPAAVDDALPLAAMLGDAGDGFARATLPREFRFPADHGPHPDFRNEWWYFTGNVRTTRGEPLGFQLTVFRFGLTPERVPSASHWQTHDLLMAHFAITDAAADGFASFERFGRPVLGLAGIEANPLRLWLEDWSVTHHAPDTWELRARAADHGLELTLQHLKPPVPQGEGGISHKGGAPDNASYYYSVTRLSATGRIRTARGEFDVDGLAWLDREWGTSALAPGQIGWDWFALQLDGGEELMLYRLRNADGSMHPASAGSHVTADGRRVALAARDFDVEVTSRWRSPASGVSYPAEWRLRVAPMDLELTVRPRVRRQELLHTFRYWEGAVVAEGRRADLNVAAHGYVELTGY